MSWRDLKPEGTKLEMRNSNNVGETYLSGLLFKREELVDTFLDVFLILSSILDTLLVLVATNLC